MSVTHVVGIDPGLVHTGVVRLVFDAAHKQVLVSHTAVAGPDAQAVKKWTFAPYSAGIPVVFIEKYQPRSHLDSDARMAALQQDLRREIPDATVLLNTGVKKVVKKPLMELLGLWSFTTSTHHQDLRSAARIALLGMLKSEPMNRLLADMVSDHLRGETWDVRH